MDAAATSFDMGSLPVQGIFVLLLIREIKGLVTAVRERMEKATDCDSGANGAAGDDDGRDFRELVRTQTQVLERVADHLETNTRVMHRVEKAVDHLAVRPN